MSPAAQKSLAEKLRLAIQREVEKGKSLNAIAKEADVTYSALHGFMHKPGKTMTLETAEAIARVVGLRLI